LKARSFETTGSGGDYSAAGRKGGTQRDPRPYEPPRSPTISTLLELVNGIRSISSEQQARLGFDEAKGGLKLWCAGDTTLVKKPCVAVVGTRNTSSEGAARARRLAKELAEHGIVVVSGLAKGIDTEALTAAIAAGGRVVAVIGTPLDRAYPAENKRLQEEIYRDHLLISQFEPGSRVFPSHFPERNKLMAAVSDATAIIEASESSGTLHQAAECVRLKRWLFIAKSLMENPKLQWPSRFKDYPNTRTLIRTDDLLSVVSPVS
jgi:DNA processing protein